MTQEKEKLSQIIAELRTEFRKKANETGLDMLAGMQEVVQENRSLSSKQRAWLGRNARMHLNCSLDDLIAECDSRGLNELDNGDAENDPTIDYLEKLAKPCFEKTTKAPKNIDGKMLDSIYRIERKIDELWNLVNNRD